MDERLQPPSSTFFALLLFHPPRCHQRTDLKCKYSDSLSWVSGSDALVWLMSLWGSAPSPTLHLHFQFLFPLATFPAATANNTQSALWSLLVHLPRKPSPLLHVATPYLHFETQLVPFTGLQQSSCSTSACHLLHCLVIARLLYLSSVD